MSSTSKWAKLGMKQKASKLMLIAPEYDQQVARVVQLQADLKALSEEHHKEISRAAEAHTQAVTAAVAAAEAAARKKAERQEKKLAAKETREEELQDALRAALMKAMQQAAELVGVKAQQAAGAAEVQTQAVAVAVAAAAATAQQKARRQEEKLAAKEARVRELQDALRARMQLVDQQAAELVGVKAELRVQTQRAAEEEGKCVALQADLPEGITPCKKWKEPKLGLKGRSTRCKQRKKLFACGRGNFVEEASYHKRIAEAVANELFHGNRDVEEVVEGSPWFQSRQKALVKAAMGAVQERLDHAGLAVKIIGKISWGCYRTIRRVLSFDFEEPEDLTYADKDDIGRYRRVHLHLQPDAKTGLVEEIAFVMPYLPTYGKCKEEESAIIAKGPGYEVTEDGKCVTRGFDIVLERSLLLHWEAASRLDVVVVQVFGDGFQMFRCGKYVNFCLRTCGVHKLSGSAKSCETLAVWGGDDGYEETKHRVGPAFDLMEVVARTKAFNTAKGSVKCHVVSGGDYAFVSDMTGGSGAGSKFPCVYCEKPQSDLWHPPTKKYSSKARTYATAVAMSHSYPEDGVFPIQCPCCGPISEEEWQVEHDKEKSKTFFSKHALEHFGQRYDHPPLLKGVDHADMPGCMLHVLLCIVGAFYKRAIAQNVETEDQVTSINGYLKTELHVFIRPPKIVKKGEEKTLLKRPSFVGEEAGKVIEHLEDLMQQLNQGAPISELQKLQLKAADEFMHMYNLVSERVVDAQVAAQRATKARAVGRQAANFIKAYVVAFGNSACTVYTHYVAHHLAHQIRDIPCDIMALSGQALEHCNQLRKQEGKLTSKNPQPWSETKDHKRKRTMMDELMVLEECRLYYQEHSEYKQRPTRWMRNVQRQGRHCSAIVKKEAIDWKAE